mmetsp:Transcript_20233/g.48234  ORF Transcript_20233/g.48234 Transcript_20233/m.48234 type:complete len:183 (+) Transcript_20233:2278-2826(+)
MRKICTDLYYRRVVLEDTTVLALRNQHAPALMSTLMRDNSVNFYRVITNQFKNDLMEVAKMVECAQTLPVTVHAARIFLVASTVRILFQAVMRVQLKTCTVPTVALEGGSVSTKRSLLNANAAVNDFLEGTANLKSSHVSRISSLNSTLPPAVTMGDSATRRQACVTVTIPVCSPDHIARSQ